MFSSVRKILKRGGGGGGGARNFRKSEKNKDQNRIVPPKFSPIFAQNQVKSKKKKKGLHSNLVRFFAQSWVQAYNKRIKHILCVIQARRQKFAMGGCSGVWGQSPQPPEARGSGGGAPSARKFCIFLQK